MTDPHPKPQWQDKAANVKAFLLDVDGVLTDGGLYVGESAEENFPGI